MSSPQVRSPTWRARAEDRANRTSLSGTSDSGKQTEPPDFAAIYVANRYRLPKHAAELVAQLADIGSAP